VTYQLPAEGVSIQAPPDWNLVQDPIPNRSNPTALFEMASYVPRTPYAGCAPNQAVLHAPSGQFLLLLYEHHGPLHGVPFPSRSAPFPLENANTYECLGGGYSTLFTDQGRHLDALVVFAWNASDVLRQRVIDSLGTLQVDPAGAAGPDQNAAASWLAPPTFDAAPGWNTEITGPKGSPSIARNGVPLTWASNRPFAKADLADLKAGVLTGRVESWPDYTIRSLSSGEVVMVADLPMPGYTAPMDLAAWPIRPQPMNVHDAIGPVEGGKQFILTASISGQFVEVRFFYPSDTPTDVELAIAQQELNRLVVPSLPPAG